MTQQERILKLAHEKVAYFGTRGARQWGKSLDQAMTIAINFTINNLWISVDDSLPEFTKKVNCAKISELVLIQCKNGAITRARYIEVSGEIPIKTWECVDAGFGVCDDKVTHWMPIPVLPEGGEK